MNVEQMESYCEELGLSKITRRGENIMFRCPYHGESNPSCGIHAQKEIGGCFACGAKFNLVSLTSYMKGISYGEALDFLAERFNKDFNNVEKVDRLLYEDVRHIIEPTLSKTSLAPFNSGNITHPYLLNRGFTEKDFIDFKLGWDTESKRITIPFFNENEELLGFSSRAVLSEDDPNYFIIYGNEPKYKIFNHFNAKDYFYPMDKFESNNSIIIVEGLLDALWLHKIGYSNTLSIISAQVSKTQLNKLKLMKADKIVLALDNDEAGESGCQRLYSKLKNEFTFMRCKFPQGKKDVQECTKEELDFMFNNLEIYPKKKYELY